MFYKKSIFKFLSLGILSATSFVHSDAVTELAPRAKNISCTSNGPQNSYNIHVQINGQDIINYSNFSSCNRLDVLGSSVINKQLAQSEWKLFESTDFNNFFCKKVSFPSSIDLLTAVEICSFSDRLLTCNDDDTPKRTTEVQKVVKKNIDDSYKNHELLLAVKVLKALEILECPELVELFNTEIAKRKKNDVQFALNWNAAIKKYEFQRTAIVQAQVAATTLITCKKENHISGYHAIWFTNGQYVAVSQQKLSGGFETKIWNAKTNTFEQSFDGLAVSISRDGTKLATVCFKSPNDAGKVSAPIKIYDVTNDRELHTFSGQLAQFIGTGKQLAIVECGKISTYETVHWKNTTAKNIPDFIYGSFSPDGTKFLTAITCAYRGVYDFATKKTFSCLGIIGGFSANSQAVATCKRWYGYGLTKTYEATTGSETGEFVGKFAAFSADTSRVAVIIPDPAHKEKPLTSVYDIETGKKLYTISGDLQKFMPGNDSYALVLDEKMVYLRNCATGENVLKANATTGAFSPDGTHLFLLENDTVNIYAINKK